MHCGISQNAPSNQFRHTLPRISWKAIHNRRAGCQVLIPTNKSYRFLLLRSIIMIHNRTIRLYTSSALLLLATMIAGAEGSKQQLRRRITATDSVADQSPAPAETDRTQPVYTQEYVDKLNETMQQQQQPEGDNSFSDSMLIFIIVACSGFLLAIIVTWTCYFLAGRRVEKIEQEFTTCQKKTAVGGSATKERGQQQPQPPPPPRKGATTTDTLCLRSYDSRRPVTSVHVRPAPRLGAAAVKKSLQPSDEASVDTKRSEVSTASMQSYLRDLRKAAATLGGGVVTSRMYNNNRERRNRDNNGIIIEVSKEQDLSTVDNTSNDDDGDNSVISSESGSGFSDASSNSSSDGYDEGDDDGVVSVNSEALSLYTTKLTLQAL